MNSCNGQPWTDIDDADLGLLVAIGLAKCSVAHRLGRTQAAIATRMIRLGLRLRQPRRGMMMPRDGQLCIDVDGEEPRQVPSSSTAVAQIDMRIGRTQDATVARLRRLRSRHG